MRIKLLKCAINGRVMRVFEAEGPCTDYDSKLRTEITKRGIITPSTTYLYNAVMHLRCINMPLALSLVEEPKLTHRHSWAHKHITMRYVESIFEYSSSFPPPPFPSSLPFSLKTYPLCKDISIHSSSSHHHLQYSIS